MEKRQNFLLSFLVPCIFTLANSSPALGEGSQTFDEIVVTASRIEEPKSEVTSFVQVISKERIELSTAQDLGDLLIQAGLGHVHKYPGFLTSRVAIRGLTSDLFDQQKSRVLFLIDGAPAGTVNLSKLLLDDVERVEIVKGPASVIYGSQAMGGVVNIITKRAKEEGIEAEVSAELGSWDYYKGKAELMGKRGPVDFYIMISRSAQNDYDAKHYGRIPNTSWDLEAVSAKLGFQPVNRHDFLLNFQYMKGWKIGTPGPRYRPELFDYSDKGRTSLQVDYSNPYLKIKTFRIEDIDEWHEPLKKNYTRKKTITTGASILGNFTPKKSLRLFMGVDVSEINVKSFKLIGAPYYPRSEFMNFAVFSELKLKPFEEKLIFNVGSRYDNFKAKILSTEGLLVNPREKSFDRFTFRGGLAYNINQALSLKTNLSSGFRAPAPDELTADYTSPWGRWLGNPNLKPEKSLTFDFGLSYKYGEIKFDVAYFITNYKDKIVTLYGNVNTYQNVDGAEIQGFELNFSAELAGFLGIPFSLEPYVDLTYHTRMRSKDQAEIQNIGTTTLLWTPKWTGTFGLRGGSQRLLFDFQGIYVGDEMVIDWKFSSPTYRKAIPKKDFTIFNLALKVKPHKNVEAYAKVENLFNRAYEYVQAYPMPERTIRVGLTLRY